MTDGKVITIGGMKANTSALQLCRVLNIEENVWLELPDMPTARYGAAARIKGDVIYVLGKKLLNPSSDKGDATTLSPCVGYLR